MDNHRFFPPHEGMSLSDLSGLCGAELADPSFAGRMVTGIASLARAGEGEVTFANSRRALPDLIKSRAAAVFVTSKLAENVPVGVAALVVIMVATMVLSDVMNNAATAAVMCPIAIGAANTLGVNADTLLMAVAIGASCAFLTPIGHQNNTLILGPGGFRFGDYWRLGLPLEALIVAIATPLLLIFWPL